MIAHIQDGRITRLETDDRPDTLAAPQLRACVRGRAYLRRQYHPDRLLHPLKRTGRRGEGRFEQITWEEALDTVAQHFEDIKSRYGNSALFVPYGTGSYNQLNGAHTARRLMNLNGGCLGIYTSYSWACIQAATPTVFGTLVTGNQRQDWLNSRYILMWGWNPAEMRDGTNSDYFHQACPAKWRPGGMHRPALHPFGSRPGRRMDPHPPGHGCCHDECHGICHADGKPV